MAHQNQASQKPFRAIIVGGGLVGLSLSHGLQLANIEHVVLEKHDEIKSIYGAALMIYPGVGRVFDQFGILSKIQQGVTPLTKQLKRWPDGSLLVRNRTFKMLEEAFEMPLILFDRQTCIRHLYDNLPDQSMIRTSACLDRIEHTETGVKVFLKDGTFEEGDIVIGADGVHSRVRDIMWDYAATSSTDTIPESDKKALFTEYKGLFGVTDPKDVHNLSHSESNVILGQDITALLFTQPGIVYWALIYRDVYSRPPARFKPDEEYQEAVAHIFRNAKFGENLTFGDLWKAKIRSGLLNIEEGILDKWHAGRIVLVGDSAHKMTADIAMGANIGIESAVVLCNVLQDALASNPHHHPSTPEISALFQKYQDKRYKRAKVFADLSGKVTRMNSWQTPWQRFFVTRIATLAMFERFQTKKFIEGFAMAPKLEYVGTRTINENAKGWQMAEAQKSSTSAWVAYALITSVMAVAISYAAMSKWGMPLIMNDIPASFIISRAA